MVSRLIRALVINLAQLEQEINLLLKYFAVEAHNTFRTVMCLWLAK